MLFAKLTRLLNRGLQDSQRAQALCAHLAGRTLRVVVEGSPWAAIAESTGAAINVRAATAADVSADATVRGGVISLLTLAGSDQRAAFQRGTARIEGDGEVAQRFAELAALLRPDIEAELGQLVGHIPAHLLVRGARSAIDWSRSLLRSGLRSSADYLAHERRELVPKAEAEHFLRNVEQLRERIDRLEAECTQLDHRQQRLAGTGSAS